MKIRLATRNDINSLVNMIGRSQQTVADLFGLTKENCPKHPSNCEVDWIEADLNRGVDYFILDDHGKDVGCVAFEKATDDLCYLERLSVLPGYRKQGFGGALVDHLCREAANTGCHRVSIGIIARYDELKRWYEKHGFVSGITKTFDHLPFDVTFMERDISDRQKW